MHFLNFPFTFPSGSLAKIKIPIKLKGLSNHMIGTNYSFNYVCVKPRLITFPSHQSHFRIGHPHKRVIWKVVIKNSLLQDKHSDGLQLILQVLKFKRAKPTI